MMHLLTYLAAWIAIGLAFLAILSFAAWNRARMARRYLRDDGAHDVAYGDVGSMIDLDGVGIVPDPRRARSGATPEALREQFHDREVGRG